jgi:hypothetical protein
MTDLYIYYRVPETAAAALAPRVRAMQAALGMGQLKRRPEAPDGMQTWMEVYPAAPPDLAGRLARAVQEAGIAPYIDGARHTEVFVDLN